MKLAIDTGAERTVVRGDILGEIGYDLSRPVGRGTLRSATGHAPTGFHRVIVVESLSVSRPGLLVAAHDLPPSFRADGLLGRDFFAGHVLTLNFAAFTVSLRPPRRRWWPFAGGPPR